MTKEELKKALQGGKASKKMINVWALRWSVAAFMASIAMFVFGGFMFLLEFDDTTGEPILDLGDVCFSYLILTVIMYLIILALCRVWANLYWKNYSFKLQKDRIVVKRGVIGKRTANIPYERIQNVNVWRGILDRIFGLHTLRIETAGGVQFGGGGYGTSFLGALNFAEGSIQGIKHPKPITEYIMSRVKGQDGLGDIGPKPDELTKSEKIRLLEERILRGDISEETYKELKLKIEGNE